MQKLKFDFMIVCLAVCGLLLAGCGNRVESQVRKLSGNADERKTALIELTMVKDFDFAAIIQEVQNKRLPVAARIDLITVLARLYLRGGQREIGQALNTLANDPAPDVRKAAIRALGDLHNTEGIAPILAALKDPDPELQKEALLAIEKKNTADCRLALMQNVQEIYARTKNNARQAELNTMALKLLEGNADKLAQQADQLALRGQLREAEASLVSVLALVPDSININYKLGRFYFDNGQSDKGLALLEKYGLLLRVKKFAAVPVLDGALTDPCWEQAIRITNFYQCVYTLLPQKISGKSEVRMGYTDEALYIAYKAWEPSTKNIRSAAKIRDAEVWADDCIEIFFDPRRDHKKFYQVVVNALGAIFDVRCTGSREDKAWNPGVEAWSKVQPDAWSAEIKIPFADLEMAAIVPGTIVGFNVATVRIGNASEYGQWAPTYGHSRRPEQFGLLLFE